MEYVNLDDNREHHWKMVFEGNDVGVDGENTLVHAKSWYFYVNEDKKLIRAWYLVDCFGSFGKKVLWGVVAKHDM